MDNPDSIATMTLPPMAVLARKMACVMGQLKRLNQNGQNTQGWTFTSIDDITDAIRALMAEFGIALFSRMLKATEVKDGKTTRATVDMEFELVCADTGISKVMTWTGSAEDYSDKAVNKAAVYAEKFWLKSTFLVSTGKDPDKTSPRLDKPQERRAPEQRQPQQQQRQNAPVEQPVVVEQRKPTPAPAALVHFSEVEDKRQALVNLAIENLYLEIGDTWDDLLALCELTPDTVRSIPTGAELGKLVKAKALAMHEKDLETKKQAALPKRYSAAVNEAVFDPQLEQITFMVKEGDIKIKRSTFYGLLVSGDTNQRLNGQKQAEAMELDKWQTGSPFASTHSFPEIIIDYDVLVNGKTTLSMFAVRPATDWRNKVPEAKPAADTAPATVEELADEIPF